MNQPPNRQVPEVPEAGRETFKAVLKPLGLTQADLARKLQISTRQLDNWAADPRPDQLARIVGNLRREPEWRDAFAARLQSCVVAQQPVPAQAAAASDGKVVQAPAHPCTAYLTHRLAYLRAQSLAGVDDPGSLHASFVNLQVRPDRSAEPGQAPKPFDALDDLLAAHPHTPVWLLIGEPGGGKSTLLFDLELRRAANCLAHWQDGVAGLPELCIRVSLADYRVGTSPPPGAWLQAMLADQQLPTGAAPLSLADLAARARLRLLLDGLNEIRADSPEARLQAQQDFMHWAARWGASGQPAPLFTIRRIDLVPLSTGLDGDAPPAEVDVLPWQDDHIERYCDRRFPDQGNPVWQAFQADPRSADLLALMRNPFNLKLQCDLFRDDGGRLAPHRGALLGRIGLLRLAAAGCGAGAEKTSADVGGSVAQH